MNSEYNWSSFTVRININAPTTRLYQAWATRGGIEHWFLRLSEYKSPNSVLRTPEEPVQTGDIYKWLWHGWPDETVEYGEILECNGTNSFQFTFGKAGICSVRIYTEKDENIVELVQDNIPTDQQGMHYWHLGCKTGWTFYLAKLLEGGIDLRNKNVELQAMLNS